MEIEPEWVHLDTDENGITMNSYFVQHPEMVLGEMRMESTRFGMDSACKAYPDVPLAGLLHEAMQRIDGEIPEIENEVDRISDEQEKAIPVSYTHLDVYKRQTPQRATTIFTATAM